MSDYRVVRHRCNAPIGQGYTCRRAVNEYGARCYQHVSLSVDGHADRDQLAELLHRLDCGCGDYTAEGDGADPYYPHNADIVLASPWLRERDRAVRRAALLEAADDIDLMWPDVSQHDNAIQAAATREAEAWLRARAEAGEL